MSGLFGSDLFGASADPVGRGPMVREFLWPPFSVMDSRHPDWQARKRAWVAQGIQSELGRSGSLLSDSKLYSGGLEWAGNRGPTVEEEDGTVAGTGTSIFDPVLTELCCRWYCPAGGAVLDPFAGGSVRGVVAASLGYHYVGVDLSAAQVQANREQWEVIGARPRLVPGGSAAWVAADSRILDDVRGPAPAVDYVLTCPPYYNLEVYSDDPRDISTMSAQDFGQALLAILHGAVARLRPDRFATVVVGEVRLPGDGEYLGLVPLTVDVAKSCGLKFYNEAILVTAIGSLPVRVPAQFRAGRKVGKMHQNVLTFVKGSGKAAARAIAASAPEEVKAPESRAERALLTVGLPAAPVVAPAVAAPQEVLPGVGQPEPEQPDLFGE